MALGDFRQHRRVPCLPLGDDSIVDVLAALLEIGALERILDHVEQEGVVEDFEELVVADACGALPLPLVAPEQLSIDRCGVARERRQQVHAVGRIGRVRRGAGGSQQGRQPVHADRHLIAGAARRDARGPRDHHRDA